MSRKQKRLARFAIAASSVMAPAKLVLSGASEPLELQAAEGDAKLKRFSMTAYTGAAMNLNGWPFPVVVELSGMKVPSPQRPIFRDHNPRQIVGHSEEVEITAQRLRLSGVISGVGEAAQEVIQLSANGFPWAASIGAEPEKVEFVKEGDKVNVNGKSFSGPIYVVRASILGEVSFVPRGADPNARAKVAAQSGVSTMNPFEKWLAAKGIDAATLSDPAKAALEAAFKMETAPPPEPGKSPEKKESGDLNAIVQAKRVDQERKQKITELVASALDNIDTESGIARIEATGNEAIEKGWDVDRARQAIELQVIYARKPNAPFVMRGQREEVTGEVLEAALCATAGVASASLEKSYKPEVLEAAHRRFKGLSLHGLLAIGARRHGWRGESVKADLKSAWNLAMRSVEAAGPSTFSVPGILSNVANKAFRDAFNFVESSWRMIAAIGNVTDFKETSTYSLTGDMMTEEVPKGGQLNHGTIGEVVYSNQATTFGKLFGIDRKDLINDDLGAFTRLNAKMGRGAALKFNLVFWTEFLDNSSFFTSAHGNYDDGASDTLLDLTGLANAERLFKTITDPDGKLMGTNPAILLTPTALSAAGRTLMNSQFIIDGTSTAAQGSTNIWQGRYKHAESAYLQDSTINGSSAKAWYLLADPNDVPVIEVVFLNGQQTPIIEVADMDFDRLGTSFRVYHDFGVKKQEYRGGVKMKGEN